MVTMAAMAFDYHHRKYPLVNSHSELENHTLAFLMGKSIILTGPFSSSQTVNVITRGVSHISHLQPHFLTIFTAVETAVEVAGCTSLLSIAVLLRSRSLRSTRTGSVQGTL